MGRNCPIIRFNNYKQGSEEMKNEFTERAFEVPVDGVMFVVVASYENTTRDYEGGLTIEAVKIQGRNFMDNLTEGCIDQISGFILEECV